ncbi:MAG TPA: hypothetical protein VHP36_03655 [Chitinispirillaceae bacterium]|nr:hypothetical protein [Chitinispirillaceae bacterium]HEX3019367.1 hypothetical protein [Chitinispirillaceae bacterium]
MTKETFNLGHRIMKALTEEQVAYIIPDPATSSSDYLHSVAWVKVLFDLSPDAYARLVGQWKVNHRRKINLWKAMKNAKLPVD